MKSPALALRPLINFKRHFERGARGIFSKIQSETIRSQFLYRLEDLDQAQLALTKAIEEGKPFSIVRPGKFEGNLVEEFTQKRINPDPLCWGPYSEEALSRGQVNAGVLAESETDVDFFSRTYLEALLESTFIVTFPWTEWMSAMPAAASKISIPFDCFNPFEAFLQGSKPWTLALRDKRVLVVSAFSASSRAQFSRRHEISLVRDIMPDFYLETLDSPITFAGERSDPSWRLGLQRVTTEIDTREYDVLLVAAGGYGPPIANHAQRSGKIGIHTGSVLQLLFGISGRRWEEEGNFLSKAKASQSEWANWVTPSSAERPQGHARVERGAYW